MHRIRTYIEVVSAIIVVLGLIWLVRIFTRPIPDAFETRGGVLTVEIASSDIERQLGLSGRESLPPMEGMLFVFKLPGIYSFWMRAMRFPIDIIWLNEDFIVVDLDENVSPDSYPSLYSSELDALYILEINAGKSRELGIFIGTQLKPIFDN